MPTAATFPTKINSKKFFGFDRDVYKICLKAKKLMNLLYLVYIKVIQRA